MQETEIIYNVTLLVWYLFSFVMNIGLTILLVISKWKINVKANEQGWAAIIPYYNQYVFFKIAGKVKLFWIWLVGAIVTLLSYLVLLFTAIIGFFGMLSIGFYNTSTGSGVLIVLVISLIVFIASFLATMVTNIMMLVGLSKNFGKSGGFAAGLIFFPFIFFPILAFDKKITYIYNQQYGWNQYGQQFNNQYGNQYGQQYNNQYGNQYGQQYNNQYGNQYGQQYDNPYGSQQQQIWNQQQQQWNPYNQGQNSPGQNDNDQNQNI